MDTTLSSIITLMRLTLTDPMDGMRRLKEWRVPQPVVWLTFWLIVVLGAILTELTAMATPPAPANEMTEMFATLRANPLLAAGLQGLFMLVMVQAVYRIGVGSGGTGNYDDTVKMVVWLQLMMLAIQTVQFLFVVIAPPIAALIGLGGVIWFFWALTGLVMVLHGFQNGGKVFACIVMTMILLAFVAGIFLTAFGIIPLPEPANV